MLNNKIGFIGMGKMAEAMLSGMLDSGTVLASKVAFYDISTEQANLIQKKYNTNLKKLNDLVAESDIIFFCVKPQNIQDLLKNFPATKGKLFVSILAGTPMSVYTGALGADIAIARVMPNTPALVHAGMSAICFNENVSETQKEIAITLFSSFGEIEVVPEDKMDIVTGISGSGPAFLYSLANDIARAGEEEGLPYNQALKLIAQTMVGAGKMLLSESTPEQLIKNVASPNGTTVAGLEVMQKSQISNEIKDVIKRAIARSRELGAKK